MVFEQRLQRTLQDIGLTEKEASVYLALLSTGSATAYRIAEESEVKKPTVYVILEDLRRKGLVLKVPHAKKALFAARDIEEYVRDQSQKLASVQTALPQLRSLGSKDRPNVYFFTGLRGLSQALEHKFDFMREKTFHSFYSNLAGSDDDVRQLYRKWDEKAIANGISFQIIMAKKDAAKFYQYLIDHSKATDALSIRFLQDYMYPPNITWEIGEDFVRINDEKNVSATIIDDKATADAMRQIFQIVWEKGI